MYLIVKAGGKWSLNLCGIATFGSIFWYLLVFQPEIVLQLFCFSTTEASNSSSSMHMHIISFQWRSCQKLILHLNHVMFFTSITATNLDPYILPLFLNLAYPRTPTEHLNENKFLHIIKRLHIIFKVHGLHDFFL